MYTAFIDNTLFACACFAVALTLSVPSSKMMLFKLTFRCRMPALWMAARA